MNHKLRTLSLIISGLISHSAFAQIETSGQIEIGAKAETNAGTGQSNGTGIKTASVEIKAEKEINSDSKIEAQMKLALVGSGGYLNQGMALPYGVEVNNDTQGKLYLGDTTVTYTNNNIGQFKIGQTWSDNYFNDVAGVGAPTIDWAGRIYELKSASYLLSYTVPVGKAFISLSHSEDLRAGVAAADEKIQNSDQVAVFYEDGPLKLLGVYQTYDHQRHAVYLGGGLTVDALALQAYKKDVTHVQAAYDLGWAKLGVGTQVSKGTDQGSIQDTQVSMSIPYGDWLFGATYVQQKGSDFPNTSLTGWDVRKYEGTADGVSIGATYTIDKNTSVSFKYGQWTYSSYARYERDGLNAGLVSQGQGADVLGSSGLSADKRGTLTMLSLEHRF